MKHFVNVQKEFARIAVKSGSPFMHVVFDGNDPDTIYWIRRAQARGLNVFKVKGLDENVLFAIRGTLNHLRHYLHQNRFYLQYLDDLTELPRI